MYILRSMRQVPGTGHKLMPSNEPVRAGGILSPAGLKGAPVAEKLEGQS